MTSRQAIWLYVNGRGVVYHGHLYQIREANEEQGTCTLISLPYEWLVLNVSLSEITAEEDYDWNDEDRSEADET